MHTTTYNGFGEESVTALEALNIMSDDNFKNNVIKLSNNLTKKLDEIKEKHKDKIQQIKGTGILNGIIFQSFFVSLGNIIEKIPLEFVRDKSFFLKKLTATAISCELYEKYNILTTINDSSNSNHLCISPSLIIEEKEIDYFFNSLNKVLSNGINNQTINIILNFLKKN